LRLRGRERERGGGREIERERGRESSNSLSHCREREVFIDNLLVRIHVMSEMSLVDRPCFHCRQGVGGEREIARGREIEIERESERERERERDIERVRD